MDSFSASEKQEADKMAIHTAERLLKEIRPKTRQALLLYKVLEGYIMMISATKTKGGAERALTVFSDITAAEVSICKVSLGISTYVCKHVMVTCYTPQFRYGIISCQ